MAIRHNVLMPQILYLLLCFLIVSCSTESKKSTPGPTSPPPRVDLKLIKQDIYNGFAAKIEYQIDEDVKQLKLKCHDKEAGFDKIDKGIRFFVSAPYKFKSDKFKCELSSDKFGWTTIVEFSIKPYAYKQEFLKVPKKHVDLSKEAIERWKKEVARLKEVYAAGILDRALFSEEFRRPLNSKVTSLYGKRRVFNNKKDSWHSGIDFRARRPTPIPSSNRGKVAFTGDLFFNGKTVIIDHGLGIFTLYCHLSKIKVQEGEIIPRGEIIGLSGNTGRSSAPHLHWGVKISGNWINGFSLLDQGI